MAQSAVDKSWIHSLNTVLPILLQQKNDSLILTVLIGIYNLFTRWKITYIANK
jgi:hypothetical protein